MLRKLDRNPKISSNDAVNIAGEQDALYHLKLSINSIDVEASEVPTFIWAKCALTIFAADCETGCVCCGL